MNKKRMKIIVVVLIAAALIVGAAALGRNMDKIYTPEEPAEHTRETTADATEEAPSAAPDFTVYDEQGNAHRLSDFLGKPVILNFWATWCGPCRNEMPELQKAFEKYGDDINFMMVDLTDGQSETVEQAADYVAQQGYTFPVYFDTQMEGAFTYGVSSIPLTFFIDREGYFVAYYLGSMDETTLQQKIDTLLTGK